MSERSSGYHRGRNNFLPYTHLAHAFNARGVRDVAERRMGSHHLKIMLAQGVPEAEAIRRIVSGEKPTMRANPRLSLARLGTLGAVAIGAVWLAKKL